MERKNMIKWSVLVVLSFFMTTTLLAQIRMASGIEKGSYNVLAKDMVKICGDLVQIDTMRQKVMVYNNNQEVVAEKDSVMYSKSTKQFIALQTSGGSVDNYRRLKFDKADVAFLQYDVLLLEEAKSLKGGSNTRQEIKMLFPIGTEEIHIVTRNDGYIRRVKDLKNGRVGIGTKQQGTQVTALFMKKIYDIGWYNFEYDLETSMKALLKGELDAFFFVGSAPVVRFSELSSMLKYDLTLVPIEDEEMNQYYVKTVIKAGTYNWIKEDVPTYAVKYGLAANTLNETEQDRNNLRKLVFDVKNNIDRLAKEGHPKWAACDFDFSGIDWEIHPISKELFGL